MSAHHHAQSAREELLSLLNISRDNVPNYDELAELVGACLEVQFQCGRRYEQEIDALMSNYASEPDTEECGQRRPPGGE